MAINCGDKVVDLVGNLGTGKVIDIYTNYHDNPTGETLAVCQFGGDPDNEIEPTVCDRSFDQISTDLTQASPSLSRF
jgi:hypothetical protein